MNESGKENIKKIYSLLDDFIDLSIKVLNKHPDIVVILMHEYFRSLYPTDPYIIKRYNENIFLNVKKCLENNIITLKAYNKIGSYLSIKDIAEKYKNVSDDNISRMSDLFGALWEERFSEKMLNSKKVINNLFDSNNLNLSEMIKDKEVIDIGCGSGRFSIALAKLGAKKVVGIDINTQGLELAKKYATLSQIENISFIQGNVLELPFKNESFDFVFSKGVFHHTGNLIKGLEEYSRVLKRGGEGFLYLYANGGVYWHSREKMREVMKLIPMKFAISVLNRIGMPARRTIFVDSWYVPIEEYVKSEFIENLFNKNNFNLIKRLKSPRSFELDKIVLEEGEWAEAMWGEGELRYYLRK